MSTSTAEYRKSEILSGLFVCLAIVVFCLFAFRVGKFDLLGLFKGNVVVCRAYFTDVKTLQPGASVRVGGQPVGKVVAVRMVEKPLTMAQVERITSLSAWKAARGLSEGMLRQLVEVEFELSDTRLKVDAASAAVTLTQASLLAPHNLLLDPGEWPPERAPLWPPEQLPGPDGAVVPVLIATEEQTNLDELVTTARSVVRKVDVVFERLDHLLVDSEKAGGAARIITRLDELLEDAGRLVTRVGDDVLTEENVEKIGRLLDHLHEASRTGARLAGDIAALFDRERDPRLSEVIDHLAANARELEGRLDAVQSELGLLLKSARGLVNENRAEVAESIRRLRRGMWQAEMALRKIRANPAVLFFGDDEADYEGSEVDESASRRAGRAPAFGSRDETIDSPE